MRKQWKTDSMSSKFKLTDERRNLRGLIFDSIERLINYTNLLNVQFMICFYFILVWIFPWILCTLLRKLDSLVCNERGVIHHIVTKSVFSGIAGFLSSALAEQLRSIFTSGRLTWWLLFLWRLFLRFLLCLFSWTWVWVWLTGWGRWGRRGGRRRRGRWWGTVRQKLSSLTDYDISALYSQKLFWFQCHTRWRQGQGHH